METKTFSNTVMCRAELALKQFYMIGFKEQDTDAGEERFAEQMGYPRNEPHGDLSLYAKQAVIALRITREEAVNYTGDRYYNERIAQLDDQIKYLQETFIEPIEARRDSRLMSSEDAIRKPEWLTPKIQSEVATLWRTKNVNNDNPRVKAIKMIQSKSQEAGFKIGLDIAGKIIHQHCL